MSNLNNTRHISLSSADGTQNAAVCPLNGPQMGLYPECAENPGSVGYNVPVHAPFLCTACVSPLEDERLYAAAYAAATPARRQKTDRLRRPQDRRLSLGAELLLRYALRTVGVTDLSGIVYGKYGKPLLPDSGIGFSLSHSEDRVAVAVAGCEIGCDIEKILPVDLRIAERYFADGEYRDILAAPDNEARTDLFYRCWTLKESYMKATGLGMRLALDSFRILREKNGGIAVIRSGEDRNDDYTFREYREIDGYACAICAAGDCRQTELCQTDLMTLLAEMNGI